MKNPFLRFTLVVASICCLFLTGCASTSSNATSYAPPHGRANIYVFRPMGIVGQTLLVLVRVDGQTLGGLAPSYYVQTTVRPGTHVVSAQLANHTALRIHAKAGQSYFVMETVVPNGGGATVNQTLVDSSTGVACLNLCNRAR